MLTSTVYRVVVRSPLQLFRLPYRLTNLESSKTPLLRYGSRAKTSLVSLTPAPPLKTMPPVTLSHCHSHRAHSKLHFLLAGGILGLLGIGDDNDDMEGKVPLSVKRELLKAKRAHANVDFSTAEDCYHKALQLLGTSEHAQSQAYIEARAVTMNLLANLYLEQRKYEKAEATLKETLRLIMAAGTSVKTLAAIEISLKLSKIYAIQKRYKEAGVGFQWCVDTTKQLRDEMKTEDCAAMLGICYEYQGKYFTTIGEYEKALQAYREAKKIACDIVGTQSLQYATMLSNEAAAILDLKQPGYLSQSEQLLMESLKLLESIKLSPEVTQNIAVTSYNLAMVLALKDSTDSRVAELIRKSIRLLEALNDERVLEDLELYYYKLGTTLLSQGKVEDAKLALDRAKTIATKTENSVLLEHIGAVLASVQPTSL